MESIWLHFYPYKIEDRLELKQKIVYVQSYQVSWYLTGYLNINHEVFENHSNCYSSAHTWFDLTYNELPFTTIQTKYEVAHGPGKWLGAKKNRISQTILTKLT